MTVQHLRELIDRAENVVAHVQALKVRKHCRLCCIPVQFEFDCKAQVCRVGAPRGDACKAPHDIKTPSNCSFRKFERTKQAANAGEAEQARVLLPEVRWAALPAHA